MQGTAPTASGAGGRLGLGDGARQQARQQRGQGFGQAREAAGSDTAPPQPERAEEVLDLDWDGQAQARQAGHQGGQAQVTRGCKEA